MPIFVLKRATLHTIALAHFAVWRRQETCGKMNNEIAPWCREGAFRQFGPEPGAQCFSGKVMLGRRR